MFVDNWQDLKKVKSGEKFTFNCIKCGKEVTKKKNESIEELGRFLCKQCKTKENNLRKYGVESTNSLKEVKRKKEQTCIKKYGVANVTYLENHKEKTIQTNQKRYGVDFAIQREDFKKKKEETILENKKLGKYKNSLKESQNSRKRFIDSQRKKLEGQYGQLYTIEDISNIVERDKTSVEKVFKEFNAYGTIVKYVDEKKKNQILEIFKNRKEVGVSSLEKEVVEFVKNIFKGQIVENDKKILNGKELDIYIPEKKLAIEFNGLYWHSDRASLKENQLPTKEEKEFAKNRHLEKTKLCEEKNIRLIHIFEDDWINRKEIIKDIIKQALGIFDKKIFARKCEVKAIDLQIYKNFLIENHLQGYSFADIRIGLFFENELIECMGINSKGTHSKKPELVRLCSKVNFKILGGFSKLLKHSCFDTLVSYVDRGTFNGKGYSNVGFKIVKENPPTYFYVKLKHGIQKYPRYAFMRKNIEKYFKEGKLQYWSPKETEEINMYKNGFAKIWNCGTIKVSWTSL